MTKDTKNLSLSNPTCRGSPPRSNQSLVLATPVARKPVGYCDTTIETYRKQNSLSKSPPNHLSESLPLSGNESSKVTQSTSTKSLHHSTILSLMKRERVAWETRKLALESQNQRKGYRLHQSGPQLGDEHQEPSALPSLIDEKNCSSMAITLTPNSPPKYPHRIQKSSSMILHLGTKSREVNTACLLTLTGSADYIQLLSCQMGLKGTPINHLARNLQGQNLHLGSLRSATNLTLEPANVPIPSANTCTSAKTVENQDMERKTAPTTRSEMYGLQPKYL